MRTHTDVVTLLSASALLSSFESLASGIKRYEVTEK
jgi:hypothetical protein